MRGRLWVGCVIGVGLAAASLALAGEKAKEGAKERSPEVQRIVSAAREESRVMEHLDVLCNRIGPRLTGSDNLTEACEWVRDRFIEFGIDNARLEQWGEFPVGFNRGPWFGRVVEPQAAGARVRHQWRGPRAPRGPSAARPSSPPRTRRSSTRPRPRVPSTGAWVIMPPPPPQGMGGFGGRRGGAAKKAETPKVETPKARDRQGGASRPIRPSCACSARRWRPPRWPESSTPRSASCC